MKVRSRQAWLFAFTDLSFLLLISLSLIPSAPSGLSLHFAEMNPPLVPESAHLTPVEERQDAWELQVVATGRDHPSPYRLVRVHGGSGDELEALSLEREELLAALEVMQREYERPLLLPEKESFSHDFLYAAAALARVWSDGRSPTLVRPILTGGIE
jgi:hypothetical protein